VQVAFPVAEPLQIADQRRAADADHAGLAGIKAWTDPLAARAGIIEEPRLYTYLSGRTNLRLLAGYDRDGVGDDGIEEVLETVELRDRGGDRVSEYSQGMRQRLGIAGCLVRRPRLLLRRKRRFP
jgi:ABC-type multidrug transport system ATPase subunit